MGKSYKVTEEFRSFCKSLFDRRFAASAAQSDVAKVIGTDQSVISRIERGDFGEVVRESVYTTIRAYAKAYGLSAPVLEEGAKSTRAPIARAAPRAPAATARTGSVKHDATATILRLVADGTIPPEVAGIVIKALAS